jgi:hypothetical protein
LVLKQLKYYTQHAKVHIRTPKQDPRFASNEQLTKEKKKAFFLCFQEPTEFGYFTEHIMGGPDSD